ncbi:DUF3757 domain-containing protein [Candidatus Fukatsuia symbiotica]|uniref:DUF3757 domain-containing protein n=1 Tax=Candidatus Fukatsuia symbiotica TaxID=1878942 RepID=A0A2U8I5U0_9GAMM|nr:DUF3757 domain-containing protein [Candidatus Fukatsuia symbiotica]AWK14533.1 hypothetical protein CCS41_08685 [Candidatus Fukatsuia symbiotica]MEA9444828.1 DUF3757 domain-containing protein [Candidatus Fukatsuia symbiotica]
MKLKTIIAFTSVALFSVSANAGNEMNCPSIADISVKNSQYLATTPEGQWLAIRRGGGPVKNFSQALYRPIEKLERGILVTCSYELEKGDIDMRFYKQGKKQEENLIVSIPTTNKPNWQEESMALGEKFYECVNQDPTNCKFTVLTTEK